MNMPLFAGLGFLIFSLYMLNLALRNYRKAQSSLGWPVTEGYLVEVGLWGRRNVGGEMKEVERLKVQYKYEIQGKKFTSSAVTFYTLVYPETLDFAKNHPEKTNIKVHYNPQKLDESVLVPGPKPGNKRYSEIILASLGIIASATVMISGWLRVLG